MRKLGPYELLAPIGQGECGAVYRARNTLLDRDVAIKVLKPGELMVPNARALKRLFMNEAKLAAGLRHPNIVTIYDAVASDEVAYIVMERIFNGRSLQRHCKSEQERFSLPEAVSLVRKCAYGLQHAHDQGVVHRDIKPRNILLDRGNEPRIVDFGLAVAMRTDATMTYLLGAGSPLYMAPEQILEETISPQTDIFALALILYELVTGKHPFSGNTISEILSNIMKKRPAPLSRLRADVPRPLEHIVDRALAKQRGRRYGSAQDFAADLDLVLDIFRSSGSVNRVRRKAEIARALPFFKPFDDQEVREVVEDARVVKYGEGQMVLTEGDRSSALFFILQGAVRVRRGTTTVAELGPGACVGEMAALSGRPRTASVVASAPTVALMVPPEVLELTTPGCRLKLKDAFLKLLATRLENTLKLLA